MKTLSEWEAFCRKRGCANDPRLRSAWELTKHSGLPFIVNATWFPEGMRSDNKSAYILCDWIVLNVGFRQSPSRRMWLDSVDSGVGTWTDTHLTKLKASLGASRADGRIVFLSENKEDMLGFIQDCLACDSRGRMTISNDGLLAKHSTPTKP